MSTTIKRHPAEAVTVFFLLCLLPVMCLRDFSPANELRYLSIADEALADGHFFAFYNGGAPYADKPPLYFWFLMLCKSLLGRHSMAIISFFSFLCAGGIVSVMDRWVLGSVGAPVRAAAATMLLTTALFLGMSVYVRMDMLMCLFIVLSLFSYRKGKPLLFALFAFLALFTKGPVGLLVPVLSVIVHLLLTKDFKGLGKWFGLRFFLVIVPLCAVWFGLAFLEGGKEYLDNLLFHQTVDRAVNAFHHKSPPWFYFVTIWGIAAPWCLLTMPAMVCGLGRKAGDEERFLAIVSVTTFVMLSLFSSKIALYLMPMLPFLSYGFALCQKRVGWKGWMRAGLGAAAGVFAILGIALFAGYFLFERLPVPPEYAFVLTWILPVCGILAICAAAFAFSRLRRGWTEGVTILGAVLPVALLLLSPLTGEINKRTAYGPLCEDIVRAEASAPGEGKVYTIGLYRPDNIDVYLGEGRRGVPVDPESSLGEIPAGATVVLDKATDRKASGRYSEALRATGRAPIGSEPLYQIWK